jgi:tetratricopeptide (TPR) repeat protein
VRQYGIDTVLVRDEREAGYSNVCRWLDDDPHWTLVAFDDVANLYVKDEVYLAGVIATYGFQELRPSNLSMEYAKNRRDDGQYLERLEAELRDACRRFPNQFYPYYYLAVYHQIYATEAHLREAEKALEKAVAQRREFSRGHYELGFTRMKLERYDEAIAALRKAIRLTPKLPSDAYYYLGVCLFHTNDFGAAIDALEQYKRRAGLGTRVEAYQFLGQAYLQELKFKKAVSCLNRVLYLQDASWQVLADKGLAHFGLDEFDEARRCYEEAMRMDPDALKVIYNLAVIYEKLGLVEKAKELYLKASGARAATSEEEEWVRKARECADRLM